MCLSITDANWNCVATVNETGTVQERFCYDAFGRIEGLASDWNRTFTGQVYDNETGLMLYRNRFYAPTLGRFLQRDPIGYEAGDLNLVRYVSSRPCTYTDEMGTSPAVAGAIGAAAGCVLGGCLAGVRAWWRNENKCQKSCKSLGGCVAGALTGTFTALSISTGNPASGASCAASAVSTLISKELDNICNGICGKPTDMPWGCALGGAIAKLLAGCIGSWAKSAGKPLEQVMFTLVSHIAGHDVAQGCKFFTQL